MRYTRANNHGAAAPPVGVGISAFAGQVADPAWLSLGRTAPGAVWLAAYSLGYPMSRSPKRWPNPYQARTVKRQSRWFGISPGAQKFYTKRRSGNLSLSVAGPQSGNSGDIKGR
jgi:hypothetical protein